MPQNSSKQPRFDHTGRWQPKVINPTRRERARFLLIAGVFVSWSCVLVWIAIGTL